MRTTEDEVYNLIKRIDDLEYRIDYLYKRLNIEYVSPSEKPIDPRLQAMIMKGNIVEAIKIYRELHPCGLAQAKADVEALSERLRGK